MAESETAVVAVPPELPPPPVERLNDFPDRLSPMLVKELRQGLRTYTFVILFLVLQGLLALVLLTAGAAASSSSADSAGNLVSQILFCVYALAMLVVQPMRGISAVSLEIKQNTIDLMVLTRLSAWRIVLGKWSSITSQSVLIFLAVVPYLILRYFFGGMQLFAELFLMLYILTLSGVFTAITVGLSAVPNIIIRGLLPIAGAIALILFIFGVLTPELEQFVGFLTASSREFLGSLGVLVLSLYTGYFFLDLAAGMIAPAAENRSTRKRLLGIAVLTAAFWSLQHWDLMAAMSAAAYVMTLLSLEALTERNDFPAVVCGPFLRFGTLGRLFGRFFYPGWPCGTLFVALLGALLAAYLAIHCVIYGMEQAAWAMLGIVLSILVFPAALIQFFIRRTEQRFSVYLALFVTSWILTFILTMLHEVVSEGILLWIFSPIPMMLAPISAKLWHRGDGDTIALLGWALAASYYAVVLAGSVPHLRTIARLENEELERREDDDGT